MLILHLDELSGYISGPWHHQGYCLDLASQAIEAPKLYSAKSRGVDIQTPDLNFYLPLRGSWIIVVLMFTAKEYIYITMVRHYSNNLGISIFKFTVFILCT